MNRKTIYAVGIAIGIAWVGAASADITLFQGGRFNGGRITLHEATPDFGGTRFNNSARSAVVNSGRWEVCADANFRGDCKILEPGQYADLGALNRRVSSLRPAPNWTTAAGCDRDRQETGNRDHDNRDDNHRGDVDDGREARATLFEGKGFSGHSYDVPSGVLVDLAGTGFNNSVSSLRVDHGFWVFCSGEAFSGECRTFGPGDYGLLPSGFNNRISSGRRIANVYPYSQNPNWND